MISYSISPTQVCFLSCLYILGYLSCPHAPIWAGWPWPLAHTHSHCQHPGDCLCPSPLLDPQFPVFLCPGFLPCLAGAHPVVAAHLSIAEINETLSVKLKLFLVPLLLKMYLESCCLSFLCISLFFHCIKYMLIYNIFACFKISI